MNFFDAQDNARRATRRLVVAYVLATLLIVAGVTGVVAAALYSNGRLPEPAVLIATALAALLLILGATAFKSAQLSAGGSRVARDMGGTLVAPDVQDPLRRRLRNVVEEMAIASGVAVPEIYVLEQEAGINAFAAGFAPGDAAIAVTRGLLELLDRDELQGVIAHEFSHILNGDMRLNIRMMGVLFGIMVLGLIGRLMLRGSYHSRIVSSRRRGSGPALMIGLGLAILGAIGVFIARLVKAAVSRQREYLADASAVQFTRQTDGIAGALKKIAGYEEHSYIKKADPEEVSHMLFAHGAKLASLFATHPPLVDRIRALEPGFDPAALPRVELQLSGQPPADETAGTAAFAGRPAVASAALADTVGNPSEQQVRYASQLRNAIPELLSSAAHAPDRAWLVALALFVGERSATARPALDLLAQQLGDARAGLVRNYHAALVAGGVHLRLPLLEIAVPALRQTPERQLEYLLELGRRLIEIDNRVDLHEFCLYRTLRHTLGQAVAPAGRSTPRASRQAVRDAAIELLAVVADAGHSSDNARQRAFRAGAAVFGDWAANATFAPPERRVEKLERCLDVLQRMNNAARRSMVEALAAAAGDDDRLNVAEAELLRTVCATLDCPLPPLPPPASVS